MIRLIRDTTQQKCGLDADMAACASVGNRGEYNVDMRAESGTTEAANTFIFRNNYSNFYF